LGEVLELVKELEVGPLEAGEVAVDEVQGVRVIGEFLEGEGEAVAGSDGVVVLLEDAGGFEFNDLEFKQAVGEAAEALQLMDGEGELVDEIAFGGGLGAVFGFQALAGGVELALILSGKYLVPGGAEAMFDGVL
jgi:hypothetical protein